MVFTLRVKVDWGGGGFSDLTSKHRIYLTASNIFVEDCAIRLSMSFGSKKTNKQKTHKHFSDGPCGTIVPGTNFHPCRGQTGQNGDFTVELNRERPVCPRDGSHFVPGGVPFVPWTVPVLSRTPSRRKCLCLDDRQIAHLICARLNHDLYDFSGGGGLGPFLQEKGRKQAQNTP